MVVERFVGLIRDVPDFPEPGIVFKDITPVLADGKALSALITALAEPFVDRGVTKVAGIEARGFTLATPVADRLGAGFIPLRKPGKLPFETVREEYSLEYGIDSLEVHTDAVIEGGGTITHHHAVGRDHMPWYQRQRPPLAESDGIGTVEALRTLRPLKALRSLVADVPFKSLRALRPLVALVAARPLQPLRALRSLEALKPLRSFVPLGPSIAVQSLGTLRSLKPLGTFHPLWAFRTLRSLRTFFSHGSDSP